MKKNLTLFLKLQFPIHFYRKVQATMGNKSLRTITMCLHFSTPPPPPKKKTKKQKNKKQCCTLCSPVHFNLPWKRFFIPTLFGGGKGGPFLVSTCLEKCILWYIYVICQLGGPYGEKLWQSPRSQFFTIWTDLKPAKNMFFFPAVNWLYRLQLDFFTHLLSFNGLACRLPTICKKSCQRKSNSDSILKKDVLRNILFSNYFMLVYLLH